MHGGFQNYITARALILETEDQGLMHSAGALYFRHENEWC
jgi:hypothetical protein